MTQSIRSLLLLSHLYRLPDDVCTLIFEHIKHYYAQKIMNTWYNHIAIHNINLCNLINRLPILGGHNIFNQYFQYYDLNNTNVLNTFIICYKYLNPRIADKSWWNLILRRGFNGTNLIYDLKTCRCYIILKFLYRKLELSGYSSI